MTSKSASAQIWDEWKLLSYFQRREQTPARTERNTWNRFFEDSNVGHCDICNMILIRTQKFYCAMEAPESLTCRYYSGHLRPVCYICHTKLGNLTISEFKERLKTNA